VTHNPEIAEAIDKHGLVASYDDGIHTARFPAYAVLDPQANMIPFDFCILATPPDAAVEAVRDILPFLTDSAPVLCLPNGLIEARLTAEFGPERFIGGIVEFGARRPTIGKVVQTAPGGLTMGRLPSYGKTADEGLRATAQLMEDAGPVHFAQNLEGARWSKLAINCAISSLGTIGGDRLGVLMRHRFVRRLALEIWTEVVAVAHAEGVKLEKVAGTIDLDWLALDHDERLKSASPSLVAKHTLLLAVGEDNILWGTDSVWYGSAQPLIDAFRAFEIPALYQERFGYPALTTRIKRKILGLNAARVYGVDPDAALAAARRDDLGWIAAAVREFAQFENRDPA